MNEDKTDEYLLKVIAKTTGNDKLLRAFRKNPRSTLDIKRTEEGGLEFRIVMPGETFFLAVVWFVVFGIGVFAFIGWILSFLYQWAVGPVVNAHTLFMNRSILFGIYVCLETWNKEDVWNQLTRSHRIILITVILFVSTGGLVLEFLNGESLGLAWAIVAFGLITRTIFKD